MLSTLEEENCTNQTSQIVENHVFPSHIDPSGIHCLPDSPITTKKTPLKTFNDIQSLLQQNRKRDVKLILRDHAWALNSNIRHQLWPILCKQHQHGKNMMDSFYWDMVNQTFGTTDLPDKPIMLPPFVDSTHCLTYHLTRKGRHIADRIVSVLGYACPDITYSPTLYPLCAILLHYMNGKILNFFNYQLAE